MSDRRFSFERAVFQRSVLGAAGLWAAVATAGALAPDAARAQEWSVRATAAERILADDNIRLEQDSPGWVFGSVTSVDLDIESRSPLAGVNLDLGADYNRFTGAGDTSDLNSLDWVVGLGLNRRFLQTEVAARAEYRTQAVRESELEDTGATEGEADRETILGNFTIAHSLTSVDRLEGIVEVRDVSFDEEQPSPLRNPFLATTATARWAHDFSSRETGTAIARAIYYDADDMFQTTTQSYSLGALYEQRATPRLTWFAGLAIGIVDEERDTPNGRESNVDPALGFDLGGSYTLERVFIEVALSQGMQPSATGRLRQQRELRAALDYEVTSDMVATLAAVHISQRDETELTLFEEYDREYTSLEGRISWRLLPDLRFSTGYRFRRDDTGEGATSHAVFATLSYGFNLLP